MSGREIPYDFGTDDRITAKRLLEAAGSCYNRNIPVATDFLDLASQEIFRTITDLLPPVCHTAMGGYDLAERKLIYFSPNEDYQYDVPYDVIQIAPINAKFAEKLTHRDYLGAIMGLSIAREKFGDVILKDENAYVFCLKSVSGYLIENLTQVRHTMVNVCISDEIDRTYEPEYKEITGTVASVRLDSVISLGFGLSRNHAIPFIEGGKTAVNGKIITTNAYVLHDNDVVSVRALGKMRFIRSTSETRKGRIVIVIHRYQ